MRIRLQLLLPLVVGVIVGAGFVLAALLVGENLRATLLTVPGVTRERAVTEAVRAILIGGTVATALAAFIATVVARMIVVPLSGVRAAAERLGSEGAQPPRGTPVAEVQDVARGISRAAVEVRNRAGRSERERFELAALLESVSEGILQTDEAGRVVRLNRASRDLLGLPEDVVGRPVASLLRHPELRRVIGAGPNGGSGETIEVDLDDRIILATAAAQPDGGTVATFVDITDLRRLEAVRRDFVANASHELKTPLTSIRGYAESVLSGDLAEADERQFMETIARNADRLQRIVDDLLDLSRLESGRWEPELEPVPMIAAAESCWLRFADRAADQRVAFHTTAEGDDTAMADPRGLDHVFANLFDNALRHTPPEGWILVVTRAGAEPSADAARRWGRTQPCPGPWLQVEVVDSGSGIPRAVLPRIFERFYRVDPARSRAEGGTGLGLSIVRHMVETMGGLIEAESDLGKGTTLRFWLPTPPGPPAEASPSR